MAPSSDGSRTVYSSEHGRMCPHCGLPSKRCVCRKNPRGAAAAMPEGDGTVRVRREKKGRKGKTVTTLTGIPLPAEELKELARDLKQRCGSGGALKDGIVEIQGDHCEVLMEELKSRGFQVKRAGG